MVPNKGRGVFVPGKHLQPSLMYVVKAWSLPQSEALLQS